MDLDIKYKVGGTFRIITIIMVVIGIIAIVMGFMSGDNTRIWANLLLNNFYFLSLAIGATFWMTMSAITQAGWSSAYLRIPQAISMWLVVSFVLWFFMFFGIHDLYHWTHSDAVAHDPILMHKSGYLNVPFFTIRFVVFFGLWILLTFHLRNMSIKQDTAAEGENVRLLKNLSLPPK